MTEEKAKEEKCCGEKEDKGCCSGGGCGCGCGCRCGKFVKAAFLVLVGFLLGFFLSRSCPWNPMKCSMPAQSAQTPAVVETPPPAN